MAPLQRYADRRVLITGAGSGIGQACALRILGEGGRVVAADISEAGLADTRAQAGAEAGAGAGAGAGTLTTIVMDVGDEESVATGVASAVEELGGLDTLVNVAGILRSAHFLQTSLADFEKVLRVNLIGTFLVTRAALPALSEGDAPAVVNFSSTSASFAHPYMSAYAASKGGVLAMTHALAAEFGKQGIRFNCVQPGSISSGMTDGTGQSRQSVGPGLPEDADYSLFDRVAPALPLPKRAIFASPYAVAAVVAMLGSPEAFFVTGTEVRIDGGAHM